MLREGGTRSSPVPAPTTTTTTNKQAYQGGIIMPVSRRGFVSSASMLAALPSIHAYAQSKPTLSIGVLTDLSGIYRDKTPAGPADVEIVDYH
jgi:hypothetical protein